MREVSPSFRLSSCLSLPLLSAMAAFTENNPSKKIIPLREHTTALACGRVHTLRADLHGTTFAYDCRMRFQERALLASCKKSNNNSRDSTLPIPTHIFIHKHVLKSYDFFVTYTTVVSEL